MQRTPAELRAGVEALTSAAGTLQPLPTDALAIPMLCLGGRLPDKHGAIITLDLAGAGPPPGGGAAADITAWGEFHNGVAAGTALLCVNDAMHDADQVGLQI